MLNDGTIIASYINTLFHKILDIYVDSGGEAS